MYIERVQIEEGFLDGLDVAMTPGLNVIIGARGTGKTSLIELIRFCLDFKGHTAEASRRSFDHAISVLGSGQVTVTMSDGSRKVTVSRTATDQVPRASGSYTSPLVFSQTEIETVGLRSGGRLALLNSFIESSFDGVAESDAVAEARSLTAQAGTLRREIEELKLRVSEIPSIDAELAKLAPAEQQLTTFSTEASKRKQELDVLTENISKKSVVASILERYTQSIDRWRAAIENASRSIPRPEQWPDSLEEKTLSSIHTRLDVAQNQLKFALAELGCAELEVKTLVETENKGRIEVEERARQLRKELESLQTGAGNIARQGQQLRERKAHLQALLTLLKQRTDDLDVLLKKRSSVLDRLDEARKAKFEAREQAAAKLNRALAPRIRIAVSRAGQHESFSAAIVDALKGSGLRYGDLAPTLAKCVSPRELLEAAEADDVESIVDATGISGDRTARLLAHLRDTDLGALGTANVDDLVDFQLLDGADYKEISQLSTGQRCTVILPVVLRHTERILIVDQPEDHIDNAFIADTLITALLARDPQSQIIFSSHNANIPVLGNAEHVVQLGSDGRRGFALTAANLETPQVVAAITSVMEGGLQAFEKRQSFYKRHQVK